MARHDARGHSLKLSALFRQLLVSATPTFGRIRRQLATVHGEVLSPDEPELRGHEQDIPKQLRNLAIQLAHERGNRRKMRSRISRKRHKDDVSSARFSESPAGNKALVVAVEHYFEQNPRIVGKAPRLVVGVALVKNRQVQMLFD